MKIKKQKIVLFGNAVLRKAAKPVTVFHNKLYSLIDSMAYTLKHTKDGAAIAANQVGILKRVSVINYEGEYIELINPEIIEAGGKQTDYEGCLSYPGYVGLVTRPEFVRVKYTNRQGEEKIIERHGKLARCLQHEIDHLNGILYIDHVEEDYLIHSVNETKISLESVLKLAG